MRSEAEATVAPRRAEAAQVYRVRGRTGGLVTAPPVPAQGAVEKYHAIEAGRQTLSTLATYATGIVRKGVEG